MKLSQIKNIYLQELDTIYPVNEINSIFKILAESFLGLSPLKLLMDNSIPVNINDENKFLEALAQLKINKPVQYITGDTWFYGFCLKVNENVLIPRPETEELVDWIIQDLREQQKGLYEKRLPENSVKILDIGTGGGCIAIAIKKNISFSEVFAMDVSKAALDLAFQNAEDSRVAVNFFKDDILKPEVDCGLFDIIVSNPPYIHPSERGLMDKRVLNYEPHLALFTSDADALQFFIAIITFAKKHLNKRGKIYCEINERFSAEILNLFDEFGFINTSLRKDLSGKNRMIRAEWA